MVGTNPTVPFRAALNSFTPAMVSITFMGLFFNVPLLEVSCLPECRAALNFFAHAVFSFMHIDGAVGHFHGAVFGTTITPLSSPIIQSPGSTCRCNLDRGIDFAEALGLAGGRGEMAGERAGTSSCGYRRYL